MKINRRAFLKRMNWTLAGFIGILGFSGCDKIGVDEYGVPHADYTVKGAVVNKATGKPIEGIQVGYTMPMCEYGIPPANFKPKASVLTNTKGEFKLTDRFHAGEVQMIDNKPTLPVTVADDNGLFQSEYLEIDFSKAEHSGKSKGWYDGEYTVTVNVELTEIEDQ